MKTLTCSLPEWRLVGGETQSRIFTLYQKSGELCNLSNATADFAVVEFVNPYTLPLIQKSVAVSASTTGEYSEVIIDLSVTDTIDMHGKYIYQVTVKDDAGNVSIPYHGIMYVYRNIDKSFIM
ncbi:MAG: hypothetical protein PUF41_11520 [Prevotella copri]|nr:hypothetical protein [Segatella copri]